MPETDPSPLAACPGTFGREAPGHAWIAVKATTTDHQVPHRMCAKCGERRYD